MQEAGAGHDPPRRAGHGCASTLPTRHRQQCRNSLSPGMPVTPAAILAPLPKHPGPLSKELTKCHPAPPRQHPLAQTGANLGTPNTSRCSAASSPLIHLRAPKQVATEVRPKLDNLPCPGCESGGRCRRFSSCGALPTPRQQRASTLTPQGLFLREGCSAGIHCPFISLLLRSPLQRVTVLRATQPP